MHVLTKLEDAKLKLQKAEDNLIEAQINADKFNAMPENQRFATILHDRLCKGNHTDGCGWEYEDWGKDTEPIGVTRGMYLEKANNVLEHVTYDVAITVLRYI